MNDLLTEETPVQEDLAQTPPAEEPQESPPPAEEGAPEKESHEPPEGSQRWKEIYYRMKEAERQLQEKDQTFEELREHNKRLQDAIEGVRDELSEGKRPDPAEDPEGFAQWMEQKLERKWERQRLEQEAHAKLKQIETPAQQQAPGVDPLRQTQIAQMEATYGRDYYRAMIALIESDLKADPMLNREIMGDDNPPAAAFDYAQKKLERVRQKKQANQKQGFVEEDSPAPAPTKIQLTEAEKRTAKALGISETDYLKQKEYIGGV